MRSEGGEGRRGDRLLRQQAGWHGEVRAGLPVAVMVTRQATQTAGNRNPLNQVPLPSFAAAAAARLYCTHPKPYTHLLLT